MCAAKIGERVRVPLPLRRERLAAGTVHPIIFAPWSVLLSVGGPCDSCSEHTRNAFVIVNQDTPLLAGQRTLTSTSNRLQAYLRSQVGQGSGVLVRCVA